MKPGPDNIILPYLCKALSGKNMDNPEKSRLYKFLRLDSIVEHLTGLLEARLELFKLEAKEEIAKILARVLAAMALAFLGVMIVVFLSFSLAVWFNAFLDSSYWGYFIVTGAYLLLFVLLIVFKVHKRIQNLLERLLIKEADLADED